MFGQFDVMSLCGCFCRQCAPILKVNSIIYQLPGIRSGNRYNNTDTDRHRHRWWRGRYNDTTEK